MTLRVRPRVWALRATLGVAIGATSCASLTELSYTVEPAVVEIFPAEGRRWTYEAENEVVIAIDRLTSAREKLAEAEAELDAEADKKKGGDAEVAKSYLAWLDVMVDLAEAEVARAERGVVCAQANLELTKAKLAVRFDLPVEEGFVEPYDKQYQECAAVLEERRLELEKTVTRSIEAKDNWRKLRVEYVRRSGDHHHGLWID